MFDSEEAYNTLKFQFHKGTIRTIKRQIKQVKRCYFNSIKVRLEPLNT